MDFAEKKDLSLFVTNSDNGIEEKYAKYIFKRIVEGIQLCHKNNIVHFDIKVGNILIDNDYNPLIIDFGLSIKYEKLDRNIKDRKGKRGTDYAMCPQMFEENVLYSGIEADIFSLGVLLFELVLNTIPFDKATNLYEYVYIKSECYKTFWNIYLDKGYNLSKKFKDLYQQLVAYDPSKRLDLDKILEHPWLEEVNDLKNNPQKEKEYIDEYKEYMSSIFNKINNSNETYEQSTQPDNSHSSTRGCTSNNSTQYISSELKPIYISQDEIQFKYFVKIKAYINPVEFMNLLGDEIAFGDYNCSVEGDEDIIKLKLEFEEPDNKISLILFQYEEAYDEFYIQFIRNECDIRDFYRHFSDIKKIIRKLIV